jgi:hypothetical protein
MSHGNTSADILKGPFPDRTPDLSRALTHAISQPGPTEDLGDFKRVILFKAFPILCISQQMSSLVQVHL